VSSETPRHLVSSFDHFVTQWMSTAGVSWGSARNSVQVHVRAASTAPSIANAHSSSAVRGVGPADKTGKSRVRYCPGGMRAGSPIKRLRPVKPREM
jgi:hypothetical protein